MGIKGSTVAGALAFLLITAGGMGVAQAKRAACFTSDDGNYACNFRGTDNAGSFTASASGYPEIMLNVDSPGVAWVFKNFGGRNVALARAPTTAPTTTARAGIIPIRATGSASGRALTAALHPCRPCTSGCRRAIATAVARATARLMP